MAGSGSKSQGIPSWQRESNANSDKEQPATSAQNDDPVYAQTEAATISQPANKSSQALSDTTSKTNNDDPVYAQAEAASATTNSDSIATSSSPSLSQSSNLDTVSDSEPDPHLRSRDSLLASASKFLQHEDLRGASLERKTAFLEGKGLSREEINDLLQTQASVDTTVPQTPTSTPPPPIITYPEFLLHAHRPKPLVTRTRIINAVYATGLISGTLYLANRYLFEPMAEQMGIARHELFETAQKGVETLNQRLEQNVSVIPPKSNGNGEAGEVASVASDPEELFHRDIGVQTSPKFDEGVDVEDDGLEHGDAVARHVSDVNKIKEHIKSLSESGKDALEEEEATRSIVGDLQAYLEELTYGGRKPAFSWENGYASEAKMGKGDAKMDEIAKFKAEIRSVKGALLSARNFPSGTNVRVR